MTVRELINMLSKLPLDLPVVVGCEYVEDYKMWDDWPTGDSANPKCEFIKAVELI